MSSDCSSEKACVGLVSIADPVAKARLRTASSSSVCARSQASHEIVSHSAAFACSQGRSGSISATIASSRSVISAITRSVSGATGNISPVKRVRRAVGADIDGVALAVALVGLEPEVGDRLDERVLVGRDPLAADLEHRAVDDVGPEAPADPVARLEHGDRQTGLAQLVGRGGAGGAGADDDDIPGDLAHSDSFVW